MNMKKFLFAVVAVVLLVGCSKWRNKEPEFTFKIQGMNLEGAKAIAHLQGGPGTKATIGFEQEEALYLVYDNNEIRLPEISFTVEFPDSYSERDKKELKEYTHVSLCEPILKDFGKYIYVYSALTYEVDLPGILDKQPIGVVTPGTQFMIPHCNTLVRKSDGLCLIVDDNIGGILYGMYGRESQVEEDSQGRYYISSYDGNEVRVGRLFDVEGGVEIRTVDVVDKDGVVSGLPRMQICNDIAYVACSWMFPGSPSVNLIVGGAALLAVSPDFTCERTYFEGMYLMGFEKYGNDAYLFVCEDPMISGGSDFAVKVYKIASGCELVASTAAVANVYGGECNLLSDVDGIFTYCCFGTIVRFDVNSGECTTPVMDEAICGYIAGGATFINGKYYHAHCPEGSNYMEVLKIDVLTETVEQLMKFDVPEGCWFDGRFSLADESEGRLHLDGRFVRNEDAVLVEEVSEDVFDPEIAEAYAKAQAEANYGIDFGSYKVVTVVPLDESLESSGN